MNYHSPTNRTRYTLSSAITENTIHINFEALVLRLEREMLVHTVARDSAPVQ